MNESYVSILFKRIVECKENESNNVLSGMVWDLVNEIVEVDPRLISVDKSWVGYGTWRTKGFTNEYHFGRVLGELIEKGLSNHIIHDEGKEPTILDYKEEIYKSILEGL